MIVGPHTENFSDAMQQLMAASAVRVVATDGDLTHSSEVLANAVDEFLRDAQAAAGMGGRAREVVLRNRGATQRTLDCLVHLGMPNDEAGMTKEVRMTKSE